MSAFEYWKKSFNLQGFNHPRVNWKANRAEFDSTWEYATFGCKGIFLDTKRLFFALRSTFSQYLNWYWNAAELITTISKPKCPRIYVRLLPRLFFTMNIKGMLRKRKQCWKKKWMFLKQKLVSVLQAHKSVYAFYWSSSREVNLGKYWLEEEQQFLAI